MNAIATDSDLSTAYSNARLIAPGRLHRIVELGRVLGELGTSAADFHEEIEEALWADGALPADTHSQQRAWKATIEAASRAYHEGAAHFIPACAADAVAKASDGGEALRDVLNRCATFADDKDIVEAVRDALTAAGRAGEMLWGGFGFLRALRTEGCHDAGADDELEVAIMAGGDSIALSGGGAIDAMRALFELADGLETEMHDNARIAGLDLADPRSWLDPANMPAAPDAPEPVDLWQRHEAPELPHGLLPDVIERFAREQAATMGADPAGLAMSALAVCASAISDEIEVQVKLHEGWRENARLWVGLVGMPSTKKTPTMAAAMRPLRRLDADMAARNAAAMSEYRSLPKADRDSRLPPPQPRRVVEDATVEALQEVLRDSPTGVLSFQDELSGWFGAMDKYSPAKGAAADRAFWLKAFNGGAYSVNRVGRGTITVPNLSIGVLGGIQPEPLRKIAADSVDDGLIQRFLPVILRPATVGTDSPPSGAAQDYERLVARLASMKSPRGEGNLSVVAPVRMGDEARRVREELEREHFELVGALESVSAKLAAHYGKHDGIFARLCLLWHCIETPGPQPGAEISGDVATRVAAFMRNFLRPSAVAFYAGHLGMSAGHEDLMAVAAFVASEGLAEVDARTVQRAGARFRSVTADEVRRIFERLESFGWLSPIEARQRSSTPRWSVVPAVHTLFAERGRLEAERRVKAKAALHAALSF